MWTDSFMRDRRVIISVDREDSESFSVTTGLRQGSRISPALFSLYIADIHWVVEDQLEDDQGISYVDGDVTWVVEGSDVDDMADELESCAAASLR